MTSYDVINSAQTIVLKIGSALIVDPETGDLRKDWFQGFSEDIKALKAQGKNIVIVSSGGIPLGRKYVGIPVGTPGIKIPLELKQASSAVGQFHLFAAYHQHFSENGLTAAQILLTIRETENRRTYLNARETLFTLLEKDIIPIINENDVISTEEIRIGDNDRLAVRVGQMIGAQVVVLFSTIDGLYTDNPQLNPQASHISVVEKITDEHKKMAGKAINSFTSGGMESKLQAAIMATRSNISLVIAHGIENHAANALFSDKNLKSTLFFADKSSNSSKKQWIGTHMDPKGSIIVDDGAIKALNRGKSLLPVGVKSLEGDFERGDIVRIKDQSGMELGLGISTYSAKDAQKIIGKPSDSFETILGYAGREELIHRNDMVLQD